MTTVTAASKDAVASLRQQVVTEEENPRDLFVATAQPASDVEKRGVVDDVREVTTVTWPVAGCLPVTMTRSFIVSGTPTDIWVQLFADCIVFGVTQREGRVGNFWLGQLHVGPTGGAAAVDHQIDPLLGSERDSPLYRFFIRQLLDRIWGLYRADNRVMPAIVLGISLDHVKGAHDPTLLRPILDILLQLYLDALQETGGPRDPESTPS